MTYYPIDHTVAFAIDAPVKASDIQKIDQNIDDHETRIVNGEAGGFPIAISPAAGNYLIFEVPWAGKKSSGGIYAPLTTSANPLTIKVALAGTYRLKFTAKHDAGGAGVGYAKLYKNGATAVGTERALTTSYVVYSEDIALAAGDTIEVWAKVTDGATSVDAYDFGLYVATPIIAGASYV